MIANELKVRRATAEDAEAIAAIHVGAFHAAYRGLLADGLLDSLSVAERAESWRTRLADSGEAGQYTVVAERHKSIRGFCAVVAPSRDADALQSTAEVAACYVDPGSWREGVGGTLLASVIGELSAEGWLEVTLWVLIRNAPARSFYARFGFTTDGARRNDRGGEEVRLRRRPQ